MRHRLQLVLRAFVLAAAALAIAAPARAGFSASVSFFYDDLSPYGRWVTIDGYGDCWHPYRVREGWRPYLDGRWVYTDAGWTWLADEEWGWAPYHYGRWLLDPEYGWVWVPGDEWAPAWVSWYYGDGYVGWAPLPPHARWVTGVGLDLGGVDVRLEMGPRWYTFVPETRFVDVPVREYAVPVTRNPELFRVARPYTDYAVVQGAVVDRGIPVQTIEHATRRTVPQLRLQAAARTPGSSRITGGQVLLFRPAVHVTADAALQRHELQRHELRHELRHEPGPAPRVTHGQALDDARGTHGAWRGEPHAQQAQPYAQQAPPHVQAPPHAAPQHPARSDPARQQKHPKDHAKPRDQAKRQRQDDKGSR